MDVYLFNLVNHGMQNDFFDVLMPAVSKYRNWIPVGVLLFGYLIYRDGHRGLLLFFLAAVCVTLSDFISAHLLKVYFARPRPCITLPDVHLLAGCTHSGSFPSSHAANSFAIASVLGFYDKNFWYVGIPAAVLVMVSRLYLGVHYPSDVAFGAVIGVPIGYAAVRLSRLRKTTV
jgi:undecaprenyl-diphosphatase